MVWSNVWQKDCVAIIDPEDGLVHGWVLFHGLKKEAAKETQTPTWKMDVLNGWRIFASTVLCGDDAIAL